MGPSHARDWKDEDVPATRDHHVARAGCCLLPGVKLKQLIGSRTRHPGLKTFALLASPEVDYVGDCLNLAQFGGNSFEALTPVTCSSTSLADLKAPLTEWHRVLMPGGKLMVAVPDMNILAQLFVWSDIKDADKVLMMQMMFGGQTDETDFHCIGFDLEILGVHLHMASKTSAASRPSAFSRTRAFRTSTASRSA